MTIPMKYEDVVAKLDAALGREAALREELEMAKQVQEVTDAVVTMVDGQRDRWIEKCGLLKQRLTVAERRNTELVRLLRSLNDCTDWWGWGVDESLRAPVEAALKPAEEVEALGTHPPGCKFCSWCGFKAEKPAPIPAMHVALGQSQTDLQEGRTVSVEQLRDNLAAKFIGKKP